MNDNGRIINGNVLDPATWSTVEDSSVHCCVTSPPYWGLRDYGGWRMCVAVGSLDDFAMPRKHPERWLVRMKVRAAARGGIESPNGRAWIGALGLEDTPKRYIAHMVDIFRHVRRVLRDDGTLWLNMGDSYVGDSTGGKKQSGFPLNRDRSNHPICRSNAKGGPGLKTKDLVGTPWMLAFALRDDGWYLRAPIIWHKPNPMPESARDRPTTAHEYIFLLTKKPRYFYDAEAISEPCSEGTHDRISQDLANQVGSDRAHAGGKTNGRMKAVISGSTRKLGDAADGVKNNESFAASVVLQPRTRNKRSVWTVGTQSYPEAHFATFPEALIAPCILAGTSEKGCCPECDAPWARMVESERIRTRPGHGSKIYKDPEGGPYEQYSGSIVGNRDPGRHISIARTTGWSPSCECRRPCNCDYDDHSAQQPDCHYDCCDSHEAPSPVPCTVLDPFLGSGTTAAVATIHGRDYLGIELNAEYIAMAEVRIGIAKRPGTYSRQAIPDDSPLFGEGAV